MYQTILFDLDGTITESAPGIIASIRHAMDTLQLPALDESTLNLFIGPPLTYSFKTYAQLDDETAQLATKIYRERYNTIGLYESTLYDGIESILQQLKVAGKRLYIATAKPEPLARRILAHYQLDRYFDDIVGATFDGVVATKEQVIELALSRNPNIDPKTAVMIGDRHHDMEGARQHHIEAIGVLYGYGDRDELIQAGATHIVDVPQDLLKLM
ncbi:HAD hydrolase-like protein [Tuanshanicoccus lijuaniae]|uniref:HAD hydrolase-like protein n=1 Tax=Aerococcaceae bacterium zg-1292 TaxID=2774330 RepID=UPI001BD82DAE|nr:HAD hydrolase-like protein [Aerococcaceae bacterium zg-A91]MBS4458393.1 HAD hydrolase-like protein [Aerococcaceae bacterium zg-BR33]